MGMDSISKFLVRADRVIDYMPFISIGSNIVDLVAKIAFNIFSYYYPSMYERIKDNVWINHIVNQKSVSQCLGMATPFFNIFLALCRDYPAFMTEVLKDRPPAVDQVFDRTRHEPVARAPEPLVRAQEAIATLNERIQQSERIKAQAKITAAANVVAKEEEKKQKLAEIDAKIAACPPTEKGQKMRENLVSFRETTVRLYESMHANLAVTQQLNGF